jgi:hypothetical protein
MKMCIVKNSFRKPKCEEKEYFPSDSINMFKKYALAENKQEVLDKYERLRKQDTKYDIGDEIFVYKIGDEWHLSSIDDEDQREELDEEETEKINVLMRNKATGYPSGNMTITTPSYETHQVDTDDDDNYDELGGKRRRRRFTRRKVRKTLARKSRRGKHVNKKRPKKTRRKHRKR